MTRRGPERSGYLWSREPLRWAVQLRQSGLHHTTAAFDSFEPLEHPRGGAPMSYLRKYRKRGVPQWQPLPGQTANSAGGHAFAVDRWVRLHRFLVLGSEGGSYYATEQRLTRENARVVEDCLAEDGLRTV